MGMKSMVPDSIAGVTSGDSWFTSGNAYGVVVYVSDKGGYQCILNIGVS